MKVVMIEEFTIKNDYVTLGQFLKDENIISSGGQAKWYLQDNPVLLNGVKESRRGKKLRPGDKVEVEQKVYELR